MQQSLIGHARRCNQTSITAEEALWWFARTKELWLLVLDNADDPTIDCTKYFPPCDWGCIILNTRNRSCCTHATAGSEELYQLDDSQATELLMKASKIDRSLWSNEQTHAEKIVKLLGAHTLAVVQAGALVSQSFCTLQEYPALFDEQRAWLLDTCSDQAKSPYGTVYQTFEASATLMQASNTAEAGYGARASMYLGFLSSREGTEDLVRKHLFEGRTDPRVRAAN